MTWPNPTLMSIYVVYPNKQNRGKSLERIREALNRICAGEIDGKPRTQEEAVAFLRERTEEARRFFYGREKHWVPHSTTWFHQSRYLRPHVEGGEVPENLEACVQILAAYPTTPGVPTVRANVNSFLPALRAIDAILKSETISFEDLLRRVKLYRDCVSEWPKDDLKYIPNPRRWFDEHRFEQSEDQWRRKPSIANYQSERNQVLRLVKP